MRAGLSLLALLLLSSCATRQLITPDGVRLQYRVAGKGEPTVVLLHGGPGSNFNAVWPDLTRLGRLFTVVMYDQYFVDETAMTRRRGSSCDAPAEGVRNYQVVNDATIASLGDWNFLPLLQKVVVPTLVIEGAGSRPTVESVRAWASALPNNQLVLVPNAGHFPQVEQPEAFFPVVESFLARR